MREIKKVIKNETERKYIEVPVKKEYYECSDGKVFEKEKDALFHQIDLDKDLGIYKIHKNMYALEIKTDREIDKNYMEYMERFIRRSLEFNRSSDEINIVNKKLLKKGMYYISFDTDIEVYGGDYVYIDCELIPLSEVLNEIKTLV